ncbi:MAG: serine hydrolase domain-containing protein [Myxococcota bacterium]
MSEVHGRFEPRFAAVRDAFAQNLPEEVGAACCVYWRGAPVVDVWGGLADRDSGAPWQEDTAGIVFSTTKGLTATLVHRLVEGGVLDLDTPVAALWPEFAAEGKGGILLRDVLTHRAGLAAVDGNLTLEDVLAWQPVCDAIAAQKPNWEPGTAHGYHARSFGWILGECVRRATGKTLGQVFAEEAAAPLGLDFWIGLPDAEQARVATLYGPPEPTDPKLIALREKFMGPETLLGRVLSGPSNLFQYGPMWNEPAVRAAEMPSSNGIGTARALARFYAAVIGEIDGTRLLSSASVDRARAEQASGDDAVIPLPTTFGLGFMLPPTLGVACPEGSFGHPGAGGSLAFADPERELAFGYVMNQMQTGITGDPRSERLVEALYASID